MGAKLEWRGTVEMGRNCTIYGNKVIEAVNQVALYFAPVLETYAKANKKWVDRTGNATQSLHSFVEMFSKDAVHLILSHGVFYGIFLESKYASRYSIIWPTLQAHLQAIFKMVKDIFS